MAPRPLFLAGGNDVLENADDFLYPSGAASDLGRGVRLFARDQTEQEHDPCLGHYLDVGGPKLPVSEKIAFDFAGDVGIVASGGGREVRAGQPRMKDKI